MLNNILLFIMELIMNLIFAALERKAIIDIVLACLIALAFSIYYFLKHKNYYLLALLSILYAGAITFYALNFKLTAILLLTINLTFTLIFAITNSFRFKNKASLFHNKRNKKTSLEDEHYAKIQRVVESFSKTKTGALITFEKEDDLSDLMASGTIIDAPISVELLETIFYVGTRLHDGAVIIRGNMIAAASVYYQPTKKALTGKFGSRHRAAFGISEETDSVTVVVSEETGRISIAYKGKLTPVTKDEFLRQFKDYMNA